jgi:polyhydroxybutyrate depolymerase
VRATVVSLLIIAALVLAGSCGDGQPGSVTDQSLTTGTPPGATETASADRVSSGCDPARPHEAGNFNETILSGGVEREYILHVPPSYTGREAVPLVLNLHGYSSNAQQQALYSGFGPKADEEGFVVVTPQGAGTPSRWDIRSDSADVAFIEDLLDELSTGLCIEGARVYSTGISNGAAMSVTLACALPDRIAAIGPVAGVFFCPSIRPIAVIAFHGTDDPVVPFEGGSITVDDAPVAYQGVENWMGLWAAHNGCADEPVEENPSGSVRLVRYTGCDEGASVELYVVEGGGHTWPGALDLQRLGATTHEISATDLIWEFFAAHPMP